MENGNGGLNEVMPKSIVNSRRQLVDVYCTFATYFIAPVIGKHKFDNICYRLHFSSFVSKSDEAFALLTYENNYNCWTDMAQKNNWGSSAIKPEYTTGGNSVHTPIPRTGVSNARSQGWSMKGIRRFNELFDLIGKERGDSFGPEFDNLFLDHCLKEKEQDLLKSSKNNLTYEVCRHELWCDTNLNNLFADATENSDPEEADEEDHKPESTSDNNNDNSVGFAGHVFEA